MFTVCGRAGSKGCRNKNISTFHGAPLVHYTLAAIKLYKDAHPDENVTVALNTDSDELKKIVGAQSFLTDIIDAPRRPELADSVAAKVDVIKDTYLYVKNNYHKTFDAIIDCDLTSPIRRVADIESILAEFVAKPERDLVFTVVPSRRNPYFNMVEEVKPGVFQKVRPSNYTARQQAPMIYDLNASIYIYKPAFLESNIDKTILEYNCGISIMPDYLVLDIDSTEDLEMMDYLYGHYVERDPELKRIYDVAKNAR